MHERMLIVDDNATNREILQEIFEQDYSILVATNGAGALKLAGRYHPRVVLLDVMLPDLDGNEVCRRLRNMPGMARSRIIMVSAKAMPSECAEGYSAGADAYITKPFDEVEVMAIVRNPTSALLAE
jgi:putative two-component system response regulator